MGFRRRRRRDLACPRRPQRHGRRFHRSGNAAPPHPETGREPASPALRGGDLALLQVSLRPVFRRRNAEDLARHRAEGVLHGAGLHLHRRRPQHLLVAARLRVPGRQDEPRVLDLRPRHSRAARALPGADAPRLGDSPFRRTVHPLHPQVRRAVRGRRRGAHPPGAAGAAERLLPREQIHMLHVLPAARVPSGRDLGKRHGPDRSPLSDPVPALPALANLPGWGGYQCGSRQLALRGQARLRRVRGVRARSRGRGPLHDESDRPGKTCHPGKDRAGRQQMASRREPATGAGA